MGAAMGAAAGRLQGKVALVTGGAGGMGIEVCQTLAGHGASVVVVDVVPGHHVASKITATGGKAIAVKADMKNRAEVAAAFDKAVEAFGAVHIVVHLAAIQLFEHPTIQTTSDEDWDLIFSTNCRGSFLVAREAANRLGPGGRIVLTSSNLATSPQPGFGAYACTKAAVDCLVKTLVKELAGRKITVNAIAPGPTKTPMLLNITREGFLEELIKMSPMARLGEPSDISPVVSFLVSDEAEWVNGEIIKVGGGF